MQSSTTTSTRLTRSRYHPRPIEYQQSLACYGASAAIPQPPSQALLRPARELDEIEDDFHLPPPLTPPPPPYSPRGPPPAYTPNAARGHSQLTHCNTHGYTRRDSSAMTMEVQGFETEQARRERIFGGTCLFSCSVLTFLAVAIYGMTHA